MIGPKDTGVGTSITANNEGGTLVPEYPLYAEEVQRVEKIRLFCLPYAGGSSLFYTDLKAYLNPSIELCPIDLAGHGMRMGEGLNTTMDQALNDVFGQMEKVGFDQPFALLGYSMGASIAYYLYFYLKERGQVPQHVYFMANTPPYVPDDDVPASDLPDDEFLDPLAALGGLSQEVLECKELVDLFLPIMRADVRLEEGSLASDPSTIDCNMSVIYSTQDDEGGQVEQWKRCAGRLCDFHRFEGTHFFMLDHYPEVAEIINRTLH